MPGYTRRTEYKESPYANDLIRIMAGKGPYSKSQLAEALGERYPKLTWQELMNEVSYAIQLDSWSKKNRFKRAEKGGYELNK
jgi:hypothetical protein